jgi:hypothetical protein
VPLCRRHWLRIGRVAFGVVTGGLAIYLTAVGLDKADKLASVVSAIVALIALGVPYLLRQPAFDNSSTETPDRVKATGTAHATNGGQANTGLQGPGGARSASITRSGDAVAGGPGSVANSGIQRRPAGDD